MKFATWNCSGALHSKHRQLFSLDAALMVIQECSKQDVEQLTRSKGWSSWWVGSDSAKKGLAVLAKPPWFVREAKALTPKWSGRVVIDGPATIELFPVWAHKSENPAIEYIEQVHLLLDVVESATISPFTIIAGDFNSNSIWDKWYKKNHSSALERFRKLKMESAYHLYSGSQQGAERDPTHWNLKKKDAAFHIDYVFLSSPLLSKLTNVVVGSYDDWLSSSDHAPMVIKLNL